MKRIHILLALCLLFAACSKEEEKPTPEPLNYDYVGRMYASIPQPPSTLCRVFEFVSKDSLTFQYRKQSWDGEPLTGNVYRRSYYFDYEWGHPSIIVKNEGFENDSTDVAIYTIASDTSFCDIFNKFYYRVK